MVRRALQSRSLRRVQRKTPGGRTVTHFEKKRSKKPTCGICGAKLNSIPRQDNIKKIPKSSRRAERPYPELCPKCMREKIKEKLKLFIKGA
ncbi:MAG: 50S ribosomal protein L34e [Candidatus Aenigmatarchaeota archaeon]|nr:50S ribosomal protein L34e [Candidatus Aenigmarchaeota archaeon]